MKFADINRRYTEIVAEWLAKGYTINTATMGGSQGEIAKVDLTDGHEIIRIFAETFSNVHTDSLCGIEITVGRYDANYDNSGLLPNREAGLDIIWNVRLKVLSNERFYKLGTNCKSGESYYGSWSEAEAAKRRHLVRRSRKERKYEPKQFTSDQAKEIGKRIIRRQCGVKRIREDDIKVSYSMNGNHKVYCVHYGNMSYQLK